MGKRHTCNCYDCAEARPDREAYRRGGIDDGWEDTPYRKPGRANWNGKKHRACKKSKSGEQCDYSATRVKGMKRNSEGMWVENYIRVCSRCGKENWSFYSWW